MATEEERFSAQKQEKQPGLEHAMDLIPQASDPNYNPSNKLRGKVALVTGGDSGIGRAVCYMYALEGASVAFTYVKDREEKDAHETLRMMKEVKTSDAKDPIAIAADVGYDDSCKRVVDQVVDVFGRIDILVNNAAEQHYAESVEEIGEERLERVFRTNIFSQFFLTRHALRHMKEGSCIINSTSVSAYKGDPELLDYCSTKGAIVAFTRGLALHLADKGIRVNAVSAGPTMTPIRPASMPEDKVVKYGSETPMGRAAQPYEIAPSYVILACNHCASYFTGQVLHPNGRSLRYLRRKMEEHHQVLSRVREWIRLTEEVDDLLRKQRVSIESQIEELQGLMMEVKGTLQEHGDAIEDLKG